MKHILFILTLFLFTGCLIGGYPTGQITLAVVDEDGNPLTGIEAGTSWSRNTTSNPFDGQTGTGQDAMVDEYGKATFSASAHRNVGYGAEAPGYYRSIGSYEFTGFKNGKWQPWNPTVTLRVRKIGEPIAMYAKNIPRFTLPAHEVSYDLIKGDFLPPHGKGETADCIFTAEIERKGKVREENGSFFSQNLTVSVPGDFNGLSAIAANAVVAESAFRLPRHAPAEGYARQSFGVYFHSRLFIEKGPGRTVNRRRVDTARRTPEADHFFFRIRSETNPDGTFKSTLYGKLRGPLKCAGYSQRTGKRGENHPRRLRLLRQPHPQRPQYGV